MGGMDREAFAQLFHGYVVAPLEVLGFIRSGESLTRRDHLNTISLIRLGGRMARPGGISHLLCFRHSFLRDRSETTPTQAPQEPFDYPFKFQPSQLQSFGEPFWRYEPQNLSYAHDRFEWLDRDRSEVCAWLDNLSNFIAGRFISWVMVMTPETTRTQLQRYGEQAWCERMWLEDYDRYIAASLSPYRE